MSYRPSMAEDAIAFPPLDDSELAVLEALGSRRSVAVGEYLYREGESGDVQHFIVVPV